MSRAKSAFTLIELLVVIAIIALLISILVPSLKQARELAKESVCLANMRAIGQALAMYSEERQSRIPYYYGVGNGKAGVVDNNRGATDNIWADELIWSNYVQPRAFACPTDSQPLQKPDRPRCSYGENRIVGDLKYKVMDVRTPTETINVTPTLLANPKVSIHDYRKPKCDTHRGADNFAFIAGNARRVTFKELFYIPYDPALTYPQLWEMGYPSHNGLHPGCGWGWQNNDHEGYFKLWDPRK
jgi:prepilin-type N-terminal cleavage/methylation domain-containing protein